MLVSISLVHANSIGNTYFTAENGVELTKAQYDNLIKVYTLEEINILPAAFIEQIKNDTKLRLIGYDEAYYITQTYFNKDNLPIKHINIEVSETEARKSSSFGSN